MSDFTFGNFFHCLMQNGGLLEFIQREYMKTDNVDSQNINISLYCVSLQGSLLTSPFKHLYVLNK